MAEEATRPRLGRGLAALIGEAGDDMALVERAQGQRRVPIEFLRPNPLNPRKRFSNKELTDLSSSIQQRGIVQPIVVRNVPNLPDAYEIVAGERRWRAAQRVGLHEVPIVVVDIDDRTSLEYAIIENVQRVDLNPIEEAAGYLRLMQEFNHSQGDLGQMFGKSRSHIANTVRLLNLSPEIQTMIAEGQITAGHARALCAMPDPAPLAQRIVDQRLSVREVEEIAYADHDESEPRRGRPRKVAPPKDPDTRALEKALEDVLGLAVSVEHRGRAGELRIRYTTLEQLDALCRRLHESAGR